MKLAEARALNQGAALITTRGTRVTFHQMIKIEHRNGRTYNRAMVTLPSGNGSAMAPRSLRVAADTEASLQAEVDRLAEKVRGLEEQRERRRARLVAAESDLLDARGILSPSVPMPLVPTVAPAIEWLANDRDRLVEHAGELRAELERAYASLSAITTSTRVDDREAQLAVVMRNISDALHTQRKGDGHAWG